MFAALLEYSGVQRSGPNMIISCYWPANYLLTINKEINYLPILSNWRLLRGGVLSIPSKGMIEKYDHLKSNVYRGWTTHGVILDNFILFFFTLHNITSHPGEAKQAGANVIEPFNALTHIECVGKSWAYCENESNPRRVSLCIRRKSCSVDSSM